MCYTDSVDGTNINLKKGQPSSMAIMRWIMYVTVNPTASPKQRLQTILTATDARMKCLNSLLDQVQSLGGVMKIGSMLDAVNDNMKTDIENDQLKDMIATYWNISKENVEFKPVTGTWRSPYVYINETELEAAKQSLHNRIGATSSSVGQ
jgi:hypothetical protein